MSEAERVVVVGAGLAGAASAWALARLGVEVVVVEREARGTLHASGRNAGLIRHHAADPVHVALARDGARLLAAPPPDLAPAPLYRRTGSLLIARSAARAARLRSEAAVLAHHGVPTELLPLSELPVPYPLQFSAAERAAGLALHTPDDGVCDAPALVDAYLEAARRRGAHIRLGAGTAALCTGERGIEGVTLGEERLAAHWVVDAAGAWAAELVRGSAALPLPLVSYRRHVAVSTPVADLDPDAPWVWDEDLELYLRPEAGGLLLCACDLERRPPEDAQVEPAAVAQLTAKLRRAAPELAGLPHARLWAGLRSFVPDKRFVVGRDPQLHGLIWAAALGGHGLTTSGAVGQLVVAALRGQENPLLAALDPARLLGSGASA